MADHDIETNKNLNFEIKPASIPHRMRVKIETWSQGPGDAPPYASPTAGRQPAKLALRRLSSNHHRSLGAAV
jgi:hypothetical protein